MSIIYNSLMYDRRTLFDRLAVFFGTMIWAAVTTLIAIIAKPLIAITQEISLSKKLVRPWFEAPKGGVT